MTVSAGGRPPAELDHLVYAVPDLARAVAHIADEWGIEPVPGGHHPGLGTRNALLSLGGKAYFEVIGPDPEQPEPQRPRPFGIDDLTAPRLVTWAARVTDLDQRIAAARARGHDPGDVLHLSRQAPGGDQISWRVTIDHSGAGDGLVPFLIDWGDAPHPTERELPQITITALWGEHPTPGDVTSRLAALGFDLEVEHGPQPALVASLETPAAVVELR